MSGDEFRRFVCWSPEKVNQVVFGDLGAIPHSAERVVDMARVPIPVFPQGSEAPESLEKVLADFLASCGQAGENTIVSIVGPSGTGKTLAVKWIQHHLPDSPSRHVVYVPRSAVALSAVLELVLSGLEGPTFDNVRKAVHESAQTVVPQLQRENIHHAMSNALREFGRLETGGMFDSLLGMLNADANLYENGIGDLFNTETWRSEMVKTGGVIDRRRALLSGTEGDLTEAQMVDAVVAFEAKDLPFTDPKMMSSHPTLEPVLSTLGMEVGRQQAAEMLNRALAVALPTAGGLADPSKLFSDVRRALKQQGKELVLLFEDIALAGGVEAHWFNEYRNHQTDEIAALRVIFAVTDGHWSERVPEFVRSNTRAYRLRNPSGDDGRKVGRELIARYFNLARLGQAGLAANEWSEDETPNACARCPHVSVCHGEFGEVNGFGLYPLNVRSADLFLTNLEKAEESGGFQGFRPRRVVSDLVQRWLQTAHVEVGQGSFLSSGEDLHATFGEPFPDEYTLIPEIPDKSSPIAHRVFYTRAYYTGEPRHSTVIAEAFDLPAGSTAKCSTPGCDESVAANGSCAVHQSNTKDPGLCTTPGCSRSAGATGLCDEHSAQVPKDWNVEGGIAWHHGTSGDRATGIPEDEVRPLRALLLRLVRAQAVSLLRDEFITWKPNSSMQLRLDEHLKEDSFRVADSYGDVAAANRFSRRLERSLDSYALIAGARWLGSAESWTELANIKGTLYVAPAVVQRGRLVLEAFVEDCAKELVETMRAWASDDAATALRLRLETAELLVGGSTESDVHERALLAVSTLPLLAGATWCPKGLVELVQSVAVGAPKQVLADCVGARTGDGEVQGIDLVSIEARTRALMEAGDTDTAESKNVDLESLARTYHEVVPEAVEALRLRLTTYVSTVEAIGEDRLAWSELVESFKESLGTLAIAQLLPVSVAQASATIEGAVVAGQVLAGLQSLPDPSNQAPGDVLRSCMHLGELEGLPGMIEDFIALVVKVNEHLEQQIEKAVGVDASQVRDRLKDLADRAIAAVETMGDNVG